MTKISVILPVYNCELYIKKCLNSLVNQTLQDIEIIIINDCSTDNTHQIINEYLKEYKQIKYINNERKTDMELTQAIKERRSKSNV